MPRLLFRLHPRPGFMLVLFDHSTPAPLTSYFIGHTVTEARDRGWDRLSNGDLLAETERAGFDVLLTADKNIRYQQFLHFAGNSGPLPLSQTVDYCLFPLPIVGKGVRGLGRCANQPGS